MSTVMRGCSRTLSCSSALADSVGCGLDDGHVLGELGEEQALLEARVAAADHDHLARAAVEGPSQVAQKWTPAPMRSSSPAAPVRRYVDPVATSTAAGRDDLARRGVVTHRGAVDARRCRYAPRPAAARRRSARPGGSNALGQLGAADAVGEAGVVVEPLGHAGLAAERRAVERRASRRFSRARVDRRGEPGRPAADDHQVVRRDARVAARARASRRAPRWRARPGGAVGEHDRRDDPLAVVVASTGRVSSGCSSRSIQS